MVAKYFTFPHMDLFTSIIVFKLFYISKLIKKTIKSSVLVVFLETLLGKIDMVQSKKTNITDQDIGIVGNRTKAIREHGRRYFERTSSSRNMAWFQKSRK
jgi:hypothetical protein